MRIIAAIALCIGLVAGARQSLAQTDFTKTKYPIVLAEGLGGIDFFQIAESLQAGGATVFSTEVDPANNSTVRGQQLFAQIQDILATTGATKVNLIGHSQGGLDARYILATHPEVLASVTTVSTPHQGTPVADLFQGLSNLPLGIGQIILGVFQQLLGVLLGTNTGTDLNAALAQLSTAGAAAFNQQFPAGLPTANCGMGAASANGAALYSWGGATVRTNAQDASDFLLVVTSLSFRGQANDGLVGQCSNHFGSVIKDNFRMNHLDAINQLNGLVGADNPVEQYRAQANRLKGTGL